MECTLRLLHLVWHKFPLDPDIPRDSYAALSSLLNSKGNKPAALASSTTISPTPFAVMPTLTFQPKEISRTIFPLVNSITRMSASLSYCIFIRISFRSRLSRHERSWRRCAIEHAFDTDVFINVRPVDSNAI